MTWSPPHDIEQFKAELWVLQEFRQVKMGLCRKCKEAFLDEVTWKKKNHRVDEQSLVLFFWYVYI